MTDEVEEGRPTQLPLARTLATAETLEGIDLQSRDQEWTLARLGLARIAAGLREELYESVTLSETVEMKDIRHAAWYMLTANYRLDPAQAISVIEGFDEELLIEAVLKACLPHRATLEDRTYTAWARSALLANGIDPAKLKPADMPHVLDQLVRTKRAIPLQEFTGAGRHMALRNELLREV